MTRRAAAFVAAALLIGCAETGGGSDWDGAAMRAVARRTHAGAVGRPLLVLDRIGGATGEEMPFGIRQALTTAGFELADTSAFRSPAARVLIFDESVRVADGWEIGVVIHDAPDPTRSGGTAVRWRVRCIDSGCEAADSSARPST